MSKHKLRDDKTCLNCRYVVESRFCPNCGQENSDTRKSFHELFIHFFEDLTHYENAFWKTIRNLMFRPAALTKEYLSGKRLSYLAPVRLYIFISFVTFLLISLMPDQDGVNVNLTGTQHKEKSWHEQSRERGDADFTIGGYNSVRELDSAQNAAPANKRLSGFEYWGERKIAEVKERNTPEQFKEKFAESFGHNVPKALFLYMPFFAFGLWIFHNKKKWYYFDHGIFTLHYFSFMLLTICFYTLIAWLLNYLPEDAGTFIEILLVLFMCCWWFFYFFRSHSKFYGERKLISRLKGFALFFINLFFIIIFIVGLMLYSTINIH